MVFFISNKSRPFFEFEFKTPVKLACSVNGTIVECGAMSIDESGMFAFKKGGYGNCIFDENNHRHDMYSKCLFEIEYSLYLSKHLSEKQRNLIDKLHKSKKFQWAGERTYCDSSGNYWILHQGKKNSYRNEKGQTRILTEQLEYTPFDYYY